MSFSKKLKINEKKESFPISKTAEEKRSSFASASAEATADKKSTALPSEAGGSQRRTEDKKREWFGSEGQLAVDVYETSSDFVVSAAIAGISAEDIDILIEKDMLVIKGERPNPQESEEKNYFYQECYWGPFSRKVILPEGIDISRAEASIDKGILMIRIPKILTNKKRKIIVGE